MFIEASVCSYLHNMREGLPLSSSLQSTLYCHQVQQLHLVTTACSKLKKEPLEYALGLVAEHSAEQAEAGCCILAKLPQQLTATHVNNTSKKTTLESRQKSWLQKLESTYSFRSVVVTSYVKIWK